jgi:hypothetical protein
MRACMQEIWVKEGWKGFTRGLSVCLVWLRRAALRLE